MRDTLTSRKQYDLLSEHIRARVKKIPRYTIEYEREITEQYNDILELCGGLRHTFKIGTEVLYDVLDPDCYQNLHQIPIGNILSNPNIYETSKQKIIDTKELLHKRYLSVFQDDYNSTIKSLLNQQYEQIVERLNQNIVQAIQAKIEVLLPSLRCVNPASCAPRSAALRLARSHPGSDDSARIGLNWFIDQFLQLQTNGYIPDNLIEQLNSNILSTDYYLVIQSGLDKPDRYIEYLENLNSKLGYSKKRCIQFIQRVLLSRCLNNNLVRAMAKYRLRQLDVDDYDEDFGEFLLDFMIALDQCGNEKYFNVGYNMVNRPYTREEKKNMMSLFEYMMEIVED
jgi:hypothetical protein